MLKASEMRILVAPEAQDLQDQINRLLGNDKAWTPHGDLKVIYGPGAFTYCQALVKLEPYEPPGMSQVVPVGGAPFLGRR